MVSYLPTVFNRFFCNINAEAVNTYCSQATVVIIFGCTNLRGVNHMDIST